MDQHVKVLEVPVLDDKNPVTLELAAATLSVDASTARSALEELLSRHPAEVEARYMVTGFFQGTAAPLCTLHAPAGVSGRWR